VLSAVLGEGDERLEELQSQRMSMWSVDGLAVGKSIHLDSRGRRWCFKKQFTMRCAAMQCEDGG